MTVLAIHFFDWLEAQRAVIQAAVVTSIVALLSAVIAACTSTTNVFLKDRLDRSLARSREKDLQRDLYRRYADPLTASAESLFWRLHEVFEVGSGFFLLPDGGDLQFDRYKVESTHYRLAALLGWMTALRRELVLSAAQPDKSVATMRETLTSVTRALAEGQRVEQAAVSRLSALWEVPAPDDEALGRRMHLDQKRFLHRLDRASVKDLNRDEQVELLKELAATLGEHCRVRIDSALIASRAEEAMAALAVREAWIYRDWQDAIGDWMLVEGPTSPRRFDVRGFRAFVAPEDPGSDDLQWRQRLRDVTDGLDVSGDPQSDARIAQLGEVYLAVAKLMVGFHAAEPARSAVSDVSLEKAKAIIAAREPSEPPKRYRPRMRRRPHQHEQPRVAELGKNADDETSGDLPDGREGTRDRA